MKNQTLLIIFSVLLIVFGTIGLVLLQKPLRENSFDNRQQAAEIKVCNEVCSSNSECDVNHFCHQSRCRLADNPGNEKCENIPDQGLSFSCNEYCSDSKECADEFTCLENKCRLPDNPNDEWCRYAVKTSPMPAVDTKPLPTMLPKGGTDATLSATPISTDSAAAVIEPTPRPTPTPSLAPALPEEKTALDSLLNSLRRAGVPVSLLPIIALGAGGLILLIVFIPKLFAKNKSTPTAAPKQSPSEYEAQLQAKLDQIKQQPSTPVAPPMTTPTTPPVAPPKPFTEINP